MRTTLLASLLALCASAQDTAPDEPTLSSRSGEPAVLTFEWPERGSVSVREKVFKRGREAETRYRIEWEPATEFEGTSLRMVDFGFESISGLDLDNPVVKAGLRNAEVLASAVPAHRIAPDGRLLGFESSEGMLKRVIALLEQASDAAEVVPVVRQAFSNPQMIQIVEAGYAEGWNAWVGLWVGCAVVRGTEETWEFDMDKTGGVIPGADVFFGKRESARGVPCVEIILTMKADEDRMLRETLRLLGVVAESVETDLPDELPIQRATRTESIHAIVTTADLRPIEVKRTKTVRVWRTKDGEPQEQYEETHDWFDWEDLETFSGPLIL